MKRDIELIRKIILSVEAEPGQETERISELKEYTDEEIGYHSYLIVDAGLAKGLDTTTIADSLPSWTILHLTSTGHDFADASRNEATWKKATGIVSNKAGGMTIQIVREVLVGVIKDAIGLP